MDLKDLAVFGAALGALITSFATFRVAAGQRKIQNTHWVLSHKQTAYVKFLDARREMINLARWETDTGKLAKGRRKLLGELRPTAILMLAPEHISSAAQDIYDATKKLIDPENPTVWDDAKGLSADDIHRQTKELRLAMQKDLLDGLEDPGLFAGWDQWARRGLPN